MPPIDRPDMRTGIAIGARKPLVLFALRLVQLSQVAAQGHYTYVTLQVPVEFEVLSPAKNHRRLA